MIFTAILAGGKGARVGTKIPKQFLEIGGKPVIIHTIDRFFESGMTDYVYIAVNEMWLEHTSKLLEKYFDEAKRETIRIVCGGVERMMTLRNVIDQIAADFTLSDDDIFLSHDAVRPFVTKEIISDCIACAREHKVAMASVPSADTSYSIDENGFLTGTYDRKSLYVGQTPQGSGMKLMYDIIHSFTDDELLKMTGTSQMFINKGYSVKVSVGSVDNLKITTPMDIDIARERLKAEDGQ